MIWKNCTKALILFIFLFGYVHTAIAQGGHDLKAFKDLLAGINASFVSPEGFTEIKPLNTEKTSYQYALQLPNADFEVRFEVNDLRPEWKSYEKQRGSDRINPDSLYAKIADAQVSSMAGANSRYTNTIPQRILQYYNADLGRSFFYNLPDMAVTKHYQYALLVIIQKNHYGNISVLCLGNERGPEFFKKVNQLRSCLKFNN